MPEIGSEGYQFDATSTSIPKEGFNFWLDDAHDLGNEVEVCSEPIQNPAAICDNLVSQSVLLPMGDNSNHPSVKDDNCSNTSTCGSERSASLLNSRSSSEARSSNLDLTLGMDENENRPTSARNLWGEMSEEQTTDGGHVGNTEEVEQFDAGQLDHTYIGGNCSSDTDLLSWYCLSTC